MNPDCPAVNGVALESLATVRASYDRCCQVPDCFVCRDHSFSSGAPHMESRFPDTECTRQDERLQHVVWRAAVAPRIAYMQAQS